MGMGTGWGGVGGVGELLKNSPTISEKIMTDVLKITWWSPIIKSDIVKKEIKVFTTVLWGNYPAIMVDPPVEYLKMCNFPQIPHFPKTFNALLKLIQCTVYYLRRTLVTKVTTVQTVIINGMITRCIYSCMMVMGHFPLETW